MSEAVENVVRQLNERWLRGEYDALAELFHEQAVLLPPNGPQPIVGRAAIIDGYRRFGEMGGIHAFEIVDLRSFRFGDTAICHMRFTIDYAIGERRFDESGVEIYALNRAGDRWRIVWRTQIAAPQNEAGEA